MADPYCTTKPVTALGICRLISEGELSLHDKLGNVIEGITSPQLAKVEVQHVLNHTAGLHSPASRRMALLSESALKIELRSYQPQPGWPQGQDAGYSEVVGWSLLGMAIEELTQKPLMQYLREQVLVPLGAGDHLFQGFTEKELVENRERLAVNVSLRDLAPKPLLSEVAPWVLQDWNPAYGGYASARGLGRFYEGVLVALNNPRAALGIDPDLLNEFVSPQRNQVFDHGLGRECRFGFGFMVDLLHHSYGRHCSNRSFGHSGNAGMSFAFADPELELVVAIHYNGVLDAQTAVRYRRPVIVDAIYRHVLDRDGE